MARAMNLSMWRNCADTTSCVNACEPASADSIRRTGSAFPTAQRRAVRSEDDVRSISAFDDQHCGVEGSLCWVGPRLPRHSTCTEAQNSRGEQVSVSETAAAQQIRGVTASSNA